MANLKSFTLTRHDGTWDYTIAITDDAGGSLVLTTSVDGLQHISAALDEKLDEMVDTAERQSLAAAAGQ